MKVTVRLAAALADFTQKRIITCELDQGTDLLSLIDAIETEFPGIKPLLSTDDSQIIDSINIYVNGDNVRDIEGPKTVLKHGDQINIIPAVAAG